MISRFFLKFSRFDEKNSQLAHFGKSANFAGNFDQ